MREYLELGPVPSDETRVQVGDPNYREKSIAECRRYKQLLESMFPDFERHGCKFGIKGFPHDFGTYHEVVIYYHDEKGGNFAFDVENNLPAVWNNDHVLAAFVRTGNMDHLKSYQYD